MRIYILTLLSLFLALNACNTESNPADLQSSNGEKQTLAKTAGDKVIDSQPIQQAQQLVNTQLLPDFQKSLRQQSKTWHRGTQAYLNSMQCVTETEAQNENNQDQERCQPPKNRELVASSEKPVS